MSTVGERELRTQLRVVEFFRDALGYNYLGHWKNRPDNANVERALVANWLERQGHAGKAIDKALFELGQAATLDGGKTLYDANREVYGLLRYGVKVRPDVGENTVRALLRRIAPVHDGEPVSDNNSNGIAMSCACVPTNDTIPPPAKSAKFLPRQRSNSDLY